MRSESKFSILAFGCVCAPVAATSRAFGCVCAPVATTSRAVNRNRETACACEEILKSEKKSVLENNFCTVAEGEIFAKRKQIFFSGGRSRLVSTGVSTNQEPPFRLLRPETPAVAEGERNGVAKRHLPSSFSLFPQIFLLSRPLPPPPFSFFYTLPFLLSSFLFLSFLPLLLFPPSPPFPPFLLSPPPSFFLFFSFSPGAQYFIY